jgi:hypothetical protein
VSKLQADYLPAKCPCRHMIALAAPSMFKIALSAFLDPVSRRDAEQAGARFVVKPADCASVSALLSQTDHAPAAQPRKPARHS